MVEYLSIKGNPTQMHEQMGQPVLKFQLVHCSLTNKFSLNRFAKLLLRLPALRSIGLKCVEHLFFYKLIKEDNSNNDSNNGGVVSGGDGGEKSLGCNSIEKKSLWFQLDKRLEIPCWFCDISKLHTSFLTLN